MSKESFEVILFLLALGISMDRWFYNINPERYYRTIKFPSTRAMFKRKNKDWFKPNINRAVAWFFLPIGTLICIILVNFFI